MDFYSLDDEDDEDLKKVMKDNISNKE